MLFRAESRAMTQHLLAGYSLEITAKDAHDLERARSFVPPGTPVSVTFLAAEEMEERIRPPL